MTQKPDGDDTGPPFARHWIYYMVLKLAVLVAAVLLGLEVAGYW